jgi:hypothetical protein
LEEKWLTVQGCKRAQEMAICLLQNGHSTQHLWVSFLATIWSNLAPPIDQVLSVADF